MLQPTIALGPEWDGLLQIMKDAELSNGFLGVSAIQLHGRLSIYLFAIHLVVATTLILCVD